MRHHTAIPRHPLIPSRPDPVQTVLTDLAELKSQVGDLREKLHTLDRVTAPPVAKSPAPVPPPPATADYDFSPTESEHQSPARPTSTSGIASANEAASGDRPGAELNPAAPGPEQGSLPVAEESPAGRAERSDAVAADNRSITAAAKNSSAQHQEERAAVHQRMMAEIDRVRFVEASAQTADSAQVQAAFAGLQRTLMHSLMALTSAVQLQHRHIEEVERKAEAFYRRLHTRPE